MRIFVLPFYIVASFAAAAADTAPLAESSLYTTNRTYCLDFHHTNMSPACRREVAQVNQIILVELMERDCTILLSRQFLAEELDYYRRFRTNETSLAITDRIIAVLSNAQASGEIDWRQLRQIHTDATDSEIVSRALPWLYPWRSITTPKLAPESNDPPHLHYDFGWEGIGAQGVSSVLRQAYVGRATLWKADARVSFQGLQGEVGRHYPAPAWAQEYFGQETRPIPILMAQIIEDLRRGLKPPPPPASASASSKGKKKKRQ